MKVDLKQHRGLLFLITGAFAVLAGAAAVDIPLTTWLGRHGWPEFAEIMGRSLFAGEGLGGGDPVVLFLIVVFGIYAISLHAAAPGRIAAWRPSLGFMAVGSILAALVYVHALKWLVGRARPQLVFEGQRAFSNWYEIGAHFITEGIYHGSFTSGHTHQAFVVMTLAYVLAGSPFAGRNRKVTGWLVGLMAAAYALAMGLARCMTLAHWVTDIVGAIAVSWVSLHLLYYYILNVPRQQRQWAALRRSGLLRTGWELLLGFYLAAASLGFVIGGIGLRALGMPRSGYLWMLMAPGLILFVWGAWGSTRQIYRLYSGFNTVAEKGTCPDGCNHC